jgi:hypothetical protein
VGIELLPRVAENPFLKFAGVFKDDVDFAEIADRLRKERNALNEN